MTTQRVLFQSDSNSSFYLQRDVAPTASWLMTAYDILVKVHLPYGLLKFDIICTDSMSNFNKR